MSTHITVNKPMTISIPRNISIRSNIGIGITVNIITNMNTHVHINIRFTDPPFSGFRYAPPTTALQCLSSRVEG